MVALIISCTFLNCLKLENGNEKNFMLSIHIKTAINSLYTAKQRTLLALIGIIIGIGSVIAMVSIGVIYGEETMGQYAEMGTNIISISKFRGDRNDDKTNKNVEIPLNATLALPTFIPAIEMAVPFIDTWGGRYYFAGKRSYAGLLGVTESFRRMYKLQIKEGRFISELDKNQPYVVVGQELLKRGGFKDFKGSLIGAKVKMNRRIYTIVGTLEAVPDSVFDPYFSKYVVGWAFITHISAVQRYSKYNKEITNVTVSLKPDANNLLVTKQIEQYFAKRVKGLKIETAIAKKLIEQKEKQAQMQTLLLGAIGSISMLVAGVGIMNVMLTSVIERRREIGILRAIGARQRDIQWQFLTEAVILSLIGGGFGIAFGIGAAYLFAWFKDLQFLVSNMAILLGVGVSLGVGTFFGFYPAYKAAKLDPINALR